VLLANHGLLAFGYEPAHAVRIDVAVEEGAQLGILAQAIGRARAIPPDKTGRARE
jgi:ribulose-5-phosphate 4-epimerase/fuculose-1-phosphate aldolase